MANIPTFPATIGNEISTTLSSSVSNSDLSWTVASSAGMNTSGGYILIEEGTASEECVYIQSIAGNVLTIADNGRGRAGTVAASHSSGATITDIIVDEMFEALTDGFQVEHNSSGRHYVRGGNISTNNRLWSDSVINPQHYLMNGCINASIANNDLTVEVQSIGSGGTPGTPSTDYPAKILIHNAETTISSSLSFTLNDNTNYGSAGSAAYAGQDTFWFVYLVTNTGSTSPVGLGISRFGGARIYSDFDADQTNIKGICSSGFSLSSADQVTIIGSFKARLSATTFQWSNLSELSSNPSNISSWMNYTPAEVGWSGSPTLTGRYKVIGDMVKVDVSASGTSDSISATLTMPFTNASGVAQRGSGYGSDNGSDTFIASELANGSAAASFFLPSTGSGLGARLGNQSFTASGTKVVSANFFYKI